MSHISSACIWSTLLLEFNRFYKSSTPRFPLEGCSMIYLVAEALLFALRWRSPQPVAILSAIRIFRLCTLIVLVSIVVVYQAIPIRPRGGDEEEPLLRNNDNCTPGNGNQPSYGSITQSREPVSDEEDPQRGPVYFFSRAAVRTNCLR